MPARRLLPAEEAAPHLERVALARYKVIRARNRLTHLSRAFDAQLAAAVDAGCRAAEVADIADLSIHHTRTLIKQHRQRNPRLPGIATT